MNEYVIKIFWDNEAAVWCASSDDVPGLVLESGSFDALVERVKFTVPELLELNSVKPSSEFCNLKFISERYDKVRLSA